MNDTTHPREGRAVVLGASMAGMLAARVLAEHYDEVVLVDRDELPPTGVQRRGVPQGRHAHGLLGSGLAVLERYFPRISEDLSLHGGRICDPVRDARWFVGGGYLAEFDCGFPGVICTRPVLEGTVRERLLATPRIRPIERAEIVGLTTDSTATRITGVRLRRPGADTPEAEETLPADLVVDATGRSARSSAWLAQLGYPPPEEERAVIDLTYVTRRFRRDPAQLGGKVFEVSGAHPPFHGTGAVVADEEGTWRVSLAGHFGHRPPQDLDGYLAFADALPARGIIEVLRDSEPIDEPQVAHFPAACDGGGSGCGGSPPGSW
jgi:2-polyprenyl-6-methoxyphenol hydroxylase-like FAD-dependent oxidoreductase